MIVNLPEVLPLDKLPQFYFGDAEAIRDDLLTNPFCFCRIKPVQTFLSGRNNIIVGEKGTGKSALFRLLSEGKMSFRDQPYKKQVVIPIEADNNLVLLKQIVLKYITLSGVTDKTSLTKYRIAWEMFILFRILDCLAQQVPTLTKDLRAKVDLFKCSFTYSTKYTVADWFKSLKATVGVKLNAANPLVQDFYAKVEPGESALSKEENNANRMIQVELSIDDTKRELQEFLQQAGIGVYVLYDKLDEFVIKEAYDAQKNILQALLLCEASYYGFPNMKHYIFLRTDLFDRLDFDQLGSDKVYSRRIELVWDKSDIIDFISKRICYNYFNILGLKEIQVSIDKDQLFIDENRKSYDEDVPKPPRAKLKWLRRFIPKQLKPLLRRLVYGRRPAHRRRVTNLTDELNMAVIGSLFPDTVKHKDKNGAEHDIKFGEYVITHTATGGGATNPRIVILFLNKLFSRARAFYDLNRDLAVLSQKDGRYPLFKDEIVLSAYEDFRATMLEIFIKLVEIWKDWLMQFVSKKGNRHSFTYDQIRDLLEVDRKKEADFRRFLAFLNHVGFLCTKDTYKDYSLRKYSLPIVFQSVQ